LWADFYKLSAYLDFEATMTYKAAIFDLDGTLVNSLEDLTDATNYALRTSNQPEHTAQAIRQMVGEGTRTLISRTLAPDKRHLIAEVLKKMREKYIQICLDKTRPYMGLLEVVAELVYHKDAKLAVLTNKDQKMAQKIVCHFFNGYFQIIKGTTNAIAVKPQPHEALQVLEKLRVKPQETIFVGDSVTDVQTAKAAGIKMIGVSWGFRGTEELIKAGAERIINEPKQLLEFFA
jgi:phosphoglycolate phosphatase